MKRPAVLVAALTLWAAVASAAEPRPFTQQDFNKLARDGKPVVVDFDADKAALKQFKVNMQSTLIAFKSGKEMGRSGAAIGIDTTLFRNVGAAILGMLGLVLMSVSLQQRFASATSGIGDAGNNFIARLSLNGLKGQFAIGLALGVVWSPCVGPTLGAGHRIGLPP